MLMKALRHHCDCKWILLYVERWLVAPLQDKDGNVTIRTRGTPQGGVISPILANLFLHYAFDAWVRREMPDILFCRYADDGLLHCRSQKQAEYVLKRIERRFRECGLEIHPKKSGIIYCKDKNRKLEFNRVSFDFLGYTFKPRRCVNKQGILHPNFLPAISRTSRKAINQVIRGWHIQIKNDKSLIDLSNMFNPTVRGWFNYYGKFYPSEMSGTWRQLNWYLVQWVRRKHKRFAEHERRARDYLNRFARADSQLFQHWKLGAFP
jgi:RNA-directed DNA polymerase